jgi:hypothetical protein
VITVTLRGGPDDEPWIVIHADTIDEAVRIINNPTMIEGKLS